MYLGPQHDICDGFHLGAYANSQLVMAPGQLVGNVNESRDGLYSSPDRQVHTVRASLHPFHRLWGASVDAALPLTAVSALVT